MSGTAAEKDSAPAVLSERGATAMERTCLFIKSDIYKAWANKFCAETNPQGIVDMSMSENYLMHDDVIQKISEPNFFQYDKTMLVYNDGTGNPTLRKAIADFLTERGNAPQPIDPDKLIVINGSRSCIDLLSYLIGDPHDAFLCPTPYYGFINRDVGLKSEMEIYPVHLSSEPRPGETLPFQLTVERLEEALQEATKKGVRVRGLFLVNPNNPLGDVYKQDQVMKMLLFCKKHSLHVIMDEIYLMSIFEENVRHSSILRLRTEEIPDPERTHFIWAVSKDLGMSGMRVGVIHTWNKAMYPVLKEMADFQMIPACVQHLIANLLRDKEFMDETYFPTNHRRLREAHKKVTEKLTELGVPYLHRPSGLYVWANFSKYLREPTFTAEKELSDRFMDNGVAIKPNSQFFGKDPGWFRMIIAIQTNVIEIGLERISNVIKQIEEERGCQASAVKGSQVTK